MFMNPRSKHQMGAALPAAQGCQSASGGSTSAGLIFVVIAPSSSVSLHLLPRVKDSNIWLARATGLAASA